MATKAESSRARTRTSIDFYLVPLHRYSVEKLTTPMIKAFYRELREHGGLCPCRNARDIEHRRILCRRGRPLATGTIRRDHNVLRAALEVAKENGCLRVNPADRCAPHPTHEERLKAEIEPPTPEQVEALLAATASYRPGFALLDLAASLGARRGELCALRWSKVDLANGTITISRALSVGKKVIQEKMPKNDRERILALDDLGVTSLREYHAWCVTRALGAGVGLSPNAFVFSRSADGSDWLRPGSVTQWFSRLRDSVGLPGVRFHDLRHYMCTSALYAGADLRTVQARAGHASIRTTEKYLHVVESSDRTVAELLRARLTNGQSPGSATSGGAR